MFTVKEAHVALLMWGCIFCVLDVIYLFRCKGIGRIKRNSMGALQISAAILLFADTAAWVFRGMRGTLFYYIIRISNFGVFFMSDVILFMFNTYLLILLFSGGENGEKVTAKDSMTAQNGIPVRASAVYWISLICMVLVIISQFTGIYYYIDESNVYHRGTAHWLAIILPLTGAALDFSLIIQYRKRLESGLFRALILYMVLPVTGSVILIFYYGISLTDIGIAISAIYMFFTFIGTQDKELADMRVAAMISQIKPHFVYNTITTIQELCRENPEQAAKSMGDFAEYLRGNINSLTVKECIPFTKELEHTKKYLAIEKERFGKRINVEYDIREEDFALPALTLQPIVENSVKHGITKKKDGGTVRIQTYREADRFVIRVEDDGIGFSKIPESDSHVGIKNVRSRLRDMRDGTLEVYSSDTGTIAEIRLPVMK